MESAAETLRAVELLVLKPQNDPNMRNIAVALLFVSVALIGHAQGIPRYGCQYWKLILGGIDDYKIRYEKVYDSVINRESNRVWFDDSLFHFEDITYIVDSFGFFGPDCNTSFNNRKFLFRNSRQDLPGSKSYIIYLRSICIRGEKLTLVFKHPNSEWNIAFQFDFPRCLPSSNVFIYRVLDEVE